MASAPSGPVLGIDLGTTNSAIAITDGEASRVLADPEGNRLIPSCVSFPPDGSVLVGHVARERRLVDAPNTVYSIKRLIGRPFTSTEVQRAKELLPFAIEPSRTGGVQVRVRKGTYALPEISAMVLRHLRKVAEHALGTEVTRAVVTVPANFNELQRSATQAAGKVAGLDVLRILHEPTAATLAYGYGKARPETIAVYDFGGGTFDVTVLDLDRDVYEVVSTAGDTFLGGDDIDLAIAGAMADQCLRELRFDARAEPQAFERMRAAAEWAKCQLSLVPEAELTLEDLFVGPGGVAQHFTYRITEVELEALMRPLIARTFDVVTDALREAGRRPREIYNVVLVGGSTRIPLVRRMVEEFFGKPPRADIDPDLVVAQGAAIHAWTLAGRPSGPSLRPGTQPLGRVALRKITVADLEPAKPKRASIVEEIPKQPAFAPDLRRDAPLDRGAIAAALGTAATKKRGAAPVAVPPPSALAPDELDTPARTSLDGSPRSGLALEDAVAVLAPPSGVGARGESGLLGLDDALHDPSRRTGRDDQGVTRAKPIAAGVPAPIDAPFEEPSARPMVAAHVDDPFDVASTPREKKPRRDPTLPFGRDRAPAIDAPFGVGDAPVPEHDSLADGIAALEAPRALDAPTPALPEPAHARESPPSRIEGSRIEPPHPAAREPSARVRESMTSGLFDVELESMPPAPPEPPPRRPPPPPPRRDAPPPPPAPPKPAPRREVVAVAPEPPDPPPAHRDHAFSFPPDPISAPTPLEPDALLAGAGAPPQIADVVPHVPELRLDASAPAPLLMDVNPLSLGLETAGGFCAAVLPRNAPVPAEKSRVFSTARDDQEAVELRICQGESQKFADNDLLGTLVLDGIRKARRGAVRIDVTFLLDASGILDVRATDLDTGRAQHTRIHLQGGLDHDEIEAMRRRQERELA